VLTELSRRAAFGVTFSIPTLDDEVWRRTEPGTAHPRQRLRAISKLIAAGVKASVGMAPILPGISDRPEQLEAVVRAAREAGAVGVWANLLYLRPGTKEHFMECVARHWPDLLPRYEEEYRRGAYLPEERTRPIQQKVAALRQAHGIADRRTEKIVPAERPRQLELISA
jgi:DNA repair photolyase